MSDLQLPYRSFASVHDLPDEDRLLLMAARAAIPHAYAPYSGFRVAAAIRTGMGRVVTGFNLENASYPVCLCAEQTTIAAVRTQYPEESLEAMAITVSSKEHKVSQPASPCGQCRQLLFEQENINKHPIRLILQGEVGEIWVFDRCSDLLPFGFTGDFL
ncbi:MAG: cytidine deaminase [Saprospiraceae bacterium]|nr:cytidine deaminase [Saprospiraceae bacterium]